MPELPEVQSVLNSLAPRVLGRLITRVTIRRPDIITGQATPHALLQGLTITSLQRHGKNLALHTAPPRTAGALTRSSSTSDPQASSLKPSPCLSIHLGMSGWLMCYDGKPEDLTAPHIHVIWQLSPTTGFYFRDPRRFGGIHTFSTPAQLQNHWSPLGPDALTIQPADLATRLAKTRRPIKSALLDQHLIAGLGNIYVDELLFAVRIHPRTLTHRLPPESAPFLVRHIRQILRRAIVAGGSSIQNYRDAQGQEGAFQTRHQVYGRSGQPCLRCRATLASITLATRTTTFCPTCQPRK